MRGCQQVLKKLSHPGFLASETVIDRDVPVPPGLGLSAENCHGDTEWILGSCHHSTSTESPGKPCCRGEALCQAEQASPEGLTLLCVRLGLQEMPEPLAESLRPGRICLLQLSWGGAGNAAARAGPYSSGYPSSEAVYPQRVRRPSVHFLKF